MGTENTVLSFLKFLSLDYYDFLYSEFKSSYNSVKIVCSVKSGFTIFGNKNGNLAFYDDLDG